MPFDVKRDPVVIIRDGDVNRLVDAAGALGKQLAEEKLTTSQIRNIFGEVRNIEMNWRSDSAGSFRRTVLLQPKLAYAAKRETGNRGRGVQTLADALTACISVIRDADSDADRAAFFARFVDFFEAILAYHKYSGGKTS